MSKNPSRWGMLAVICLYCFFAAFTLQTIPPVLSLIIEDLGISHAQAGLFMSIFNLPGIFLIMPMSFASQHFSLKRIGMLSMILLLLGSVIIALAKSFSILLAGRLLIGLGAVALPVVGLQAVAKYFTGFRLGLAMGIYSSTFPLAAIVALNSFGAAGSMWGWRSVILITLATGIIVLAVFALFFKNPPDQPVVGKSSSPLALRSLIKIGWPIWILSISWGLANLCNQSLITFLPDFLYRSGMNLQIAGTLTSIFMLCGLFISPLSGHLLDKSRRKELFIVFGGLFTAIFIFLLPLNMDLIVLILVLVGISAAPIPTAIFAIAPYLVKGQLLAVAYGMIATWSYIGLFSGPYITGYILDTSGSYRYSFWFLAIVFLIVTVLGAFLLKKNGRQDDSRST